MARIAMVFCLVLSLFLLSDARPVPFQTDDEAFSACAIREPFQTSDNQRLSIPFQHLETAKGAFLPAGDEFSGPMNPDALPRRFHRHFHHPRSMHGRPFAIRHLPHRSGHSRPSRDIDFNDALPEIPYEHGMIDRFPERSGRRDVEKGRIPHSATNELQRPQFLPAWGNKFEKGLPAGEQRPGLEENRIPMEKRGEIMKEGTENRTGRDGRQRVDAEESGFKSWLSSVVDRF